MPLYALGGLQPTIAPDAFVHPDAVLIGDVRVGAGSSVWPNAVLRGDGAGIRIGSGSNIQDGSVVHCTEDLATIIGDRCVVGHMVHLEGCTLEDEVLVGSMAVVLHRCVVRTHGLVAANSVVLNDTEVPGRALAVGSPATIKPDRANVELILESARNYAARAQRYRAELRRVD